jgi:hypothetical protein
MRKPVCHGRLTRKKSCGLFVIGVVNWYGEPFPVMLFFKVVHPPVRCVGTKSDPCAFGN